MILFIVVKACVGTAIFYGWVDNKKEKCARGVMVIVVGNGHGDMSSNSGQDWLHFT